MNCGFCALPKPMNELTFLPDGLVPGVGLRKYIAACTGCQRDGTAKKRKPTEPASTKPNREPGSDDE